MLRKRILSSIAFAATLLVVSSFFLAKYSTTVTDCDGNTLLLKEVYRFEFSITPTIQHLVEGSNHNKEAYLKTTISHCYGLNSYYLSKVIREQGCP
jgi:hypothetical protein